MRSILLGIGLCSGLLLAQTDTTQTNTQPAAGQSWVGLLVASGCSSPASNPSSSTNSAMTGPAMNGSSGSGMNGTSTDMTGSAANGVNQSRTDMPRASDTYGSADRMTGDVTTRTTPDSNMPASTASAPQTNSDMKRATSYTAGMKNNTSDMARNSSEDSWDHARTLAGQLGPSCHISSSTSSFALMMPDGRVLSFDSASNPKIADQVRSRVSGNTTKIFRVEVKGTMSGDTITADSVRM